MSRRGVTGKLGSFGNCSVPFRRWEHGGEVDPTTGKLIPTLVSTYAQDAEDLFRMSDYRLPFDRRLRFGDKTAIGSVSVVMSNSVGNPPTITKTR
jgi:hypothetical protein